MKKLSRITLLIIILIFALQQMVQAKAFDHETYNEANYYYAAVVKMREEDLRRERYCVWKN